MNFGLQSRLLSLRKSLRARIALGVALPILLVLVSLSLVRNWRERQLMQDQVRLTEEQLGEVIMGSLRHAMLINDHEMLVQALEDMGAMETIQRVQIINLDGTVKADSRNKDVGTTWQSGDQGCIECHRIPAESRPRTSGASTVSGVLRISTPIPNDPDCTSCHTEDDSHLGVLLADVSVVDIEKRVRGNLRVDLATSVGSTVLVTLGLYLLIHWQVVRRVEALRRPLLEFTAGDFGSRLPPPSPPTDELGELAETFNRMADELERHIHEREDRRQVQRRAALGERERIAHELHDGLAQLLGYVNTKAMAVRMMLKTSQPEAADQNLLQLEEAARELFVDVREAILNLKTAGKGGANLTAALKDFAAQFSRLSGLPVELALAPEVENIPLPAESALQLLRIIQESLTNTRKHASATQAWVSLRVNGSHIELAVRDDGKGFEPDRVQTNGRPHFGLSTMRERAQTIGADLELVSKPGSGTQVNVRLPLEGLS